MKSPVLPRSIEERVLESRLHLGIVTTSPFIAEVLAEELREVRNVTAEVVDVVDVEAGLFQPGVGTVLIVTEAAVERWCRWRSRRSTSLDIVEVVGALGSRWLVHESPEEHGFAGSIDFKWPARDLVNELENLVRGASHSPDPVEPCSARSGIGAMCHDDIDRRIAAYITMGMSDRDIGAKVFLSSQTVRNRVSRMLERAHVTNRTQLAMICVVNPEIMRVQCSDETSTPRSESVVR